MVEIVFALPNVQIFFIILVRVAAILMSVPVFGGKGLPVTLKAGFAMALAFVIFPITSLDANAFSDHLIGFSLGIAGEVVLGLSIGLFVRMLFAGIQLAGQLAGFQMGLALANVIDPATSLQVPLLSQIYNLLAMLIFITINAHYWFFYAVVESFTLVPPFRVSLNPSFFEYLIDMAGQIFVVGIKVAAPIMAALLLTSVSFGLIARTVTQMNVFIVAMPLKIGVGMFFIIISLPYFLSFLKDAFTSLGNSLFHILKLLS